MKKLFLAAFLTLFAWNAHAWTITNHYDSCSGPSGWYCWSSSGTASIISSESATGSPSNSLQIYNPQNAGDSSVPGGSSVVFTAASELWVQAWFKYKSDFDFHSGNNKLIYIQNNTNASNLIVFDSSNGSSFQISPLAVASQTWYTPNITSTTITRGVWYKLVFHIKVNGPGSDVIEYWLNDVKQAYYSNATIAPSENPTFSKMILDPVWGGQGDSGPNVNNYQYFDHVIVSTSPIVSGGDTTAPYTDTNSPGKNSTGWPVASRTLTLYVRDFTNVTRSTIGMTINGSSVTPTITPSGSTATSYYLSYTRGSDWADNTTYTVGITAQDVYGNALNETYTFTTELAAPDPLAITTTTLPNGTVGTLYNQALAATGGVSPYSWDNTTPLPAGLQISPDGGVVTGTPTTAGADNVIFRVTDSASATDTQWIVITVDNAVIPGYPTVEIGTVADTFARGADSQNFSTGDRNYLYTWPANTASNRVYLKWDLSSVAGTVPTYATMRIYMVGYEGSGGDSSYAATVHRFTGVDPVIASLSWFTYNGTTAWAGGSDGGTQDIGAAEATVTLTKAPQYYNIDVTAMVKAWLLDPSSNKGMMINPPAVATSDSNRHIASVENPTVAFRPVLFLTYVPVPSPVKSLTVGRLTGGTIGPRYSPWWNDETFTFDAPFDDPSSPLNVVKGPAPSLARSGATATYVPATTALVTDAAENLARVEARGVLIEGARTNLFTVSEVLNASPWEALGGTIVADNTTAPDGNATAEVITDDAALSGRYYVNADADEETFQSISIFIKKVTGDNSFIAYDFTTASNQGATFLLDNGIIGYTDPVAEPYLLWSAIVSHSNGWFRSIVTYNVLPAATNYPEFYWSSVSDNNERGGNTSGNKVGFFGTQLEVGPFASSYIRTSAGTVTRNADVLTVASSGVIDNAASTIAMEWSPTFASTMTSGAAYYLFDAGGAEAYYNATDQKIYLTDGTNTVSTAALTFSANVAQKLAFRWGPSGLLVYRNGAEAATGEDFTAFAIDENLYLGSNTAGGSQAYANFKNVRAWNKEQDAAAMGMLSQ